jgi:alpha-galactosidase
MGHRPLKFTVDVAMSGALGVDMDLSRNKPADNHFLANAIRLYKNDLRDIVQHGDLYRLESPYENPRAALDFVSPDKSRAVLFIYQIKDGPQSAVVLQGLDTQRTYNVREENLFNTTSVLEKNNRSITGAALMREGLISPCQKKCDSAVIELTEDHLTANPPGQ